MNLLTSKNSKYGICAANYRHYYLMCNIVIRRVIIQTKILKQVESYVISCRNVQLKLQIETKSSIKLFKRKQIQSSSPS